MIITSRRVVFPDGIRPAAIHVRDGRLAAIGAFGDGAGGAERINAGDLMVLPGLVDTHVHINEPGRTEWEGFAHATRAAAAGGVTTLVDMPLNSIPATTGVEALAAKRRAAEGQCLVDVAFWGGVIPGNTPALEAMAVSGVRGFKAFLTPSGVDEFPSVMEADLREAAPVLARLGLPLLVHAEWPAALAEPRGPAGSYRTWLDSRPAASENAAIERLIALAREFGVRAHVVHLASAGALPILRAARAAGLSVTVETCPHYLTFAAEEIPDGATAFKAAPPIRSRADRESLWAGLSDGTIDLVATDHSPAPPALKQVDTGDFLKAWGGIASLQLGLSAVWTGAERRGVALDRVAAWMTEAPARLAGLDDRKGRIAVGCDADLVVFDPDAEWTVDGRALFHRHQLTPYEGTKLRGRVCTTMLRGEVIFDDGRLVGSAKGRSL